MKYCDISKILNFPALSLVLDKLTFYGKNDFK